MKRGIIFSIGVVSVLFAVVVLNLQPVLGLSNVQSMIEDNIRSLDQKIDLAQITLPGIIEEGVPIVIIDRPSDPNDKPFNPNRGTSQAVTIIEPGS